MGKTEIVITIVVFNLFFILFIVGIVVFIRQYKLKKKEHIGMLTSQTEAHQKELLATQIEIQQQTMQHIGREIHDNIGQKLTLASLYTQQLAFENRAPSIKNNIENISAIINQSLEELRELSKSLTDNSIAKKTIHKLIDAECKKITELKICNVVFICADKKIELSYELKSILLRITQEFIQNSIKHAKCQVIKINLAATENKIQLQLSDNGIGFDNQQIYKNGIGLANMKKRTEMLGGQFDLQSEAEIGTNLKIEIPL